MILRLNNRKGDDGRCGVDRCDKTVRMVPQEGLIDEQAVGILALFLLATCDSLWKSYPVRQECFVETCSVWRCVSHVAAWLGREDYRDHGEFCQYVLVVKAVPVVMTAEHLETFFRSTQLLHIFILSLKCQTVGILGSFREREGRSWLRSLQTDRCLRFQDNHWLHYHLETVLNPKCSSDVCDKKSV